MNYALSYKLIVVVVVVVGKAVPNSENALVDDDADAIMLCV